MLGSQMHGCDGAVRGAGGSARDDLGLDLFDGECLLYLEQHGGAEGCLTVGVVNRLFATLVPYSGFGFCCLQGAICSARIYHMNQLELINSVGYSLSKMI